VSAKVVVLEGESISQALRRLRKKVFYGNRWPIYQPKPTKRRQDYYMKPCELKRRQESLAKSRRHLHSWIAQNYVGMSRVRVELKPLGLHDNRIACTTT
jgi:ribosomal protein S21